MARLQGELYILLTVHLDSVLVNDQLDALFLNVFMYASTCFEQQVLIIRRAKLYYYIIWYIHSTECVIPDDVLTQFGPPEDEHLLLETCRGIKKECIKLVITQNYMVNFMFSLYL
jgi:hypothetical protein